jgi:hypothetical protein
MAAATEAEEEEEQEGVVGVVVGAGAFLEPLAIHVGGVR